MDVFPFPSGNIGAAEFTTVLLLLVVIVIPIAAFAFSRSGKALDQLGKGTFAIDREDPAEPGASRRSVDAGQREEEIRQMVEAAAWRRQQRGGEPVDVDAEIDRLLQGGETATDQPETEAPDAETGGLREEIRQLVRSNNDRRLRRGEPALDVESEIDRRLREWS